MNPFETVDPHLQAVVRAAENGANLHRVVVVCGSTIYVGIPASTAKFTNTNLTEFGVEFFNDAGNWKTSRQEKELIADEKAKEVMGAMSLGESLPTPDVLSLVPAQVFPGVLPATKCRLFGSTFTRLILGGWRRLWRIRQNSGAVVSGSVSSS